MSRLAASRIGFVSARPGYTDGRAIRVDAGLGRLIDALAGHCGSLEVALADLDEPGPLHEHELILGSDRFTPLPEMPSLARGFFKARACRAVLSALEQRVDALFVQLPFAAPLGLLGAHRPRLYHVCGDILEQSRSGRAFRGWKRLPARALGTFVDRLQGRLIRQPRNRVVTHGRHLEAHYRGRGRAVVSSALHDREILSVDRTRPADARFRILFVGYLRHEKGVDTLLEAFPRVSEQIPDAELVIVGGEDRVESGVRRLLDELPEALRGSVRPIGEIPFGERLFQEFADADVLVLPSRSEGTPRVLVEARAFGCPVVASRVGGIPTSVEHGVDGLLFPVGDVAQLTASIVSVAKDEELARRLSERGVARARATTVEHFARELAEELELLLSGAALPDAMRGGEERSKGWRTTAMGEID